MKTKIHRIVADPGSSPEVGTRWALVVSALAALVVVGVAVAQPGPAQPMGPERGVDPVGPDRMAQPGPRETQERLDPSLMGRRNVLSRLRDQLQDQIRDTEAALREGQNPEPRAQVLRSELETLREQLGSVDRQLGQLVRGPGRIRPGAMGPEAPIAGQPQQPINELKRQRGELSQKLMVMQDRLKGLGDDQGPEASELRGQIDQVNSRIRRIDERMDRQRANLERGRPGMERPGAGVPLREDQQVTGERMVTRVYKLQYANPEQLQRIIWSLLTPHAEIASDERTGSLIVTDTPETLRRIEDVVKQLDVQGTGERPEGKDVDDLRAQVRGLQEQMRRMQATLTQMAAQKPKDNPQP
jgi:hypothetical protein